MSYEQSFMFRIIFLYHKIIIHKYLSTDSYTIKSHTHFYSFILYYIILYYIILYYIILYYIILYYIILYYVLRHRLLSIVGAFQRDHFKFVFISGFIHFGSLHFIQILQTFDLHLSSFNAM